MAFWSAIAGRIIAFEGLDGTGKSTQSRRFFQYLLDMNHPAAFVRQPEGESNIGKLIRSTLLDVRGEEDPSPMAELMLHAFSHAIQYRDMISWAIAANETVIMDRCFLSAVCYQSARGIDPEFIFKIEEAATNKMFPDLIFVFWSKYISPFMENRETKDRMDLESSAYKVIVADNYLNWAVTHDNCVAICVDDMTEDQIFDEVLEAVEKFSKRWWKNVHDIR